LKVVVSLYFNVVEIVLQSSVRVRVAIRKLIHVPFHVETERKRHDVVAPVLRTSIIIDILVRDSRPVSNSQTNNLGCFVI